MVAEYDRKEYGTANGHFMSRANSMQTRTLNPSNWLYNLGGLFGHPIESGKATLLGLPVDEDEIRYVACLSDLESNGDYCDLMAMGKGPRDTNRTVRGRMRYNKTRDETVLRVRVTWTPMRFVKPYPLSMADTFIVKGKYELPEANPVNLH